MVDNWNMPPLPQFDPFPKECDAHNKKTKSRETDTWQPGKKNHESVQKPVDSRNPFQSAKAKVHENDIRQPKNKNVESSLRQEEVRDLPSKKKKQKAHIVNNANGRARHRTNKSDDNNLTNRMRDASKGARIGFTFIFLLAFTFWNLAAVFFSLFDWPPVVGWAFVLAGFILFAIGWALKYKLYNCHPHYLKNYDHSFRRNWRTFATIGLLLESFALLCWGFVVAALGGLGSNVSVFFSSLPLLVAGLGFSLYLYSKANERNWEFYVHVSLAPLSLIIAVGFFVWLIVLKSENLVIFTAWVIGLVHSVLHGLTVFMMYKRKED